MDLTGKSVALYGRLLDRPRASVEAAIRDAGGRVERDLTRRTDGLVVGRGSLNLIASGRLAQRLRQATDRGIPVTGEARFWSRLRGGADDAPTLPLNRVTPRPDTDLVLLLCAFDLVHVANGKCRFADASVLKTAAALADDGLEAAAIVRALLDARDRAPTGRHRVVTDASGTVRLEWGDGLTTLTGQGILALESDTDLEDAFDLAMVAEAEGRYDDAERLYALCAGIDRKDPIAPYNLANVLVRLGRSCEALHRYGQAIARDPRFAEAHYNRATCHEARGDDGKAEHDLRSALALDPDYPDALFNLGQLRFKAEDTAEACDCFTRYLATNPNGDWAVKAQRALAMASLAGSATEA